MPADKPVTTPVAASTDIALAASLQVPPDIALDNVFVWPTQIAATPVILGVALIVTVLVVKQPDGSVYLIVVMPLERPDKMPLLAMEPMAGLDEDHVPPAVALEYAPVAPTQILFGPDMAPGKALIVITLVTKQPELAV